MTEALPGDALFELQAGMAPSQAALAKPLLGLFKRLERCSDRNTGRNQPEHAVFLKNKIQTISGTQAESVPNLLWDGNLLLARERRFHILTDSLILRFSTMA